MDNIDSDKREVLYNDAISLLRGLVATPSFSRYEEASAMVIEQFLRTKNIKASRYVNNVWVANEHFDIAKPSVLLNSHHDTVRPNKDYTKDPFDPLVGDGKLYGLGANDAGGSLVSLIAAFLYFYGRDNMKYNLILAASAEEEISGLNGIEALLPMLHHIDFAIVGEPTTMQMAIAEKGLMVLDCTATGSSGHAARNEGVNAIYEAMQDIEWFRNFVFPEVSPMLGPVKMSVTLISAGTQHNVVPATCSFTVDVRLNECYTHEAALEIIRQHVRCTVQPRSMRLKATSIPRHHPILQAGFGIGLTAFGSATLSDKALMPFHAVKIGPGDSARSHTADEFIYVDEIKNGIDIYIQLLSEVL